MSSVGSRSSRRVVARFLAYALEFVELGLLVFREMGEMTRGVLERLNAGEFCHSDARFQRERRELEEVRCCESEEKGSKEPVRASC